MKFAAAIMLACMTFIILYGCSKEEPVSLTDKRTHVRRPIEKAPYDMETDEIKIWERGRMFESKISSLCTRYNPLVSTPVGCSYIPVTMSYLLLFLYIVFPMISKPRSDSSRLDNTGIWFLSVNKLTLSVTCKNSCNGIPVSAPTSSHTLSQIV